MTVTLAEVLHAAENDFSVGRYEDALRGYYAVIQGAPRYTRARYRVADTLLNLGDRSRAKDVYKGLAWHYIKSGHPLLGLVACKMVLALDPAYRDILHILAELYSSESDRVADIDLPEPPSLASGPAPVLPTATSTALFEQASRLAADTDPITQVPPKLPVIPLFSHLTEEAFIKVLGSLRLRRHTDGQRIITEGESGDSFFMLADGVVVVSKKLSGTDTVLAHLHQGAVFGEMALVSNAPRAATVSAKGDVDLLELSRRDLEVHAGELESVTQALKKFTRGRFLANLAATSPLFRPLERADRRALMAKFKPKVVYAEDIVIEQGEPGRGLYLVLRGEFKVSKKQGGEPMTLATLRGGDVFGEISLLRDTPTTATVTATTIGEVLFLPKEEFHEVLARHPEVRPTLDELTDQRLRSQRVMLPGAEIETDDSKVMI
ncbi:cyclic nucleotide-binding domain-containing protein [Myxococcota bacterium]|nr:cyclic nucleotide-binding domain-containing protein [Myxococcota bacterium]